MIRHGLCTHMVAKMGYQLNSQPICSPDKPGWIKSIQVEVFASLRCCQLEPKLLECCWLHQFHSNICLTDVLYRERSLRLMSIEYESHRMIGFLCVKIGAWRAIYQVYKQKSELRIPSSCDHARIKNRMRLFVWTPEQLLSRWVDKIRTGSPLIRSGI